MRIIDKYIGIPYVHKGRTMSGLDCWGLIKSVYKELGYQLNDLEDYEMEGHLKGHDYFEAKDEWEQVSIPKPYDVVLFLSQRGIAYHAGMLLPEGRFIHSSKQTGVVILDFERVKKTLKAYGIYRLKATNGNNKIQS